MSGELEGIRERLRCFDPAEPRAMHWFVGALRAATGCDSVVAWSFEFVDERLALASFEVAGPTVPKSRVTRLMDGWLGANQRGPGSFDVQRPEPWQRGRVVTTASPSTMLRVGVPPRYAGKLPAPDEFSLETCIAPIGGDRPTSRVLVCDGASLLAYVGMFDEHEFRPAQVRLLRSLVGPLTSRLRLEHQFEAAEVYSRGLDAAIEYLPVAAFLVSARGVVLTANHVGRAWLERDRGALGLLAQRTGPDPAVFDVTPLQVGATRHYLAVRRVIGEGTDARLSVKAHGWRLTRRETEVASWILRAATNRTIADELGCAESTVEFHVSRVFLKSGAESRSDLVVRILS